MNKKLWMRDICAKNGLSIYEHQLLKLEEFVALLVEWNKKINLISRSDIENIWSKHILGSISFLFSCSINDATTIIDIGTGGGFPGIPLAILFPNAKVTLVDSIKKKIVAVEDIVKQLQLSNVRVVNGRAEDICMKEHFHQSYGYVIARAVAPTKDLIKWCAPFLRATNESVEQSKAASKKQHYFPPGNLLFLKGGDITQEIEHAKIKMKPTLIQTFPIIIDGGDPIDSSDKKIIVIKP